MDSHQFCTIHRIGYNTDLDPHCPQCMMARSVDVPQLAFDTQRQQPVAADGTLLDKRTLQPVK